MSKTGRGAYANRTFYPTDKGILRRLKTTFEPDPENRVTPAKKASEGVIYCGLTCRDAEPRICKQIRKDFRQTGDCIDSCAFKGRVGDLGTVSVESLRREFGW